MVCSDPRTWIWPGHGRVGRFVQAGRIWTDLRPKVHQQQRLQILSRLFISSFFHLYLNLVSAKHRCPGSQSIQGTRTGTGPWFILLLIPLAWGPLGQVEFSPDPPIGSLLLFLRRCGFPCRLIPTRSFHPSLKVCSCSASREEVHLQASLQITPTRTDEGETRVPLAGCILNKQLAGFPFQFCRLVSNSLSCPGSLMQQGVTED